VPIAIILHAAKGEFKGRQKNRVYLLVIHSLASPKKIFIGSKHLKHEKNANWFLSASSGWYYDLDKKGIIHIKTPTLSTHETTVIQVR
jgi:hypothetical protein